jgi:hypothetical protein
LDSHRAGELFVSHRTVRSCSRGEVIGSFVYEGLSGVLVSHAQAVSRRRPPSPASGFGTMARSPALPANRPSGTGKVVGTVSWPWRSRRRDSTTAAPLGAEGRRASVLGQKANFLIRERQGSIFWLIAPSLPTWKVCTSQEVWFPRRPAQNCRSSRQMQCT